MTTDCSLNYKLNKWKFQAQTWGEHVVYRNCFWHSEQFLYTMCSPHVVQKEELLTKIYLYLGTYCNWSDSKCKFFSPLHFVNWHTSMNDSFYLIRSLYLQRRKKKNHLEKKPLERCQMSDLPFVWHFSSLFFLVCKLYKWVLKVR